MAKKKAKRLSPAEQHKQFVAMAKEIEADESPDALERALKKLNIRTTGTARKSRGTEG
jgi:hypothetical protein